jgi:hypothetical protein
MFLVIVTFRYTDGEHHDLLPTGVGVDTSDPEAFGKPDAPGLLVMRL